jgi:hypothetical protein
VRGLRNGWRRASSSFHSQHFPHSVSRIRWPRRRVCGSAPLTLTYHVNDLPVFHTVLPFWLSSRYGLQLWCGGLARTLAGSTAEKGAQTALKTTRFLSCMRAEPMFEALVVGLMEYAHFGFVADFSAAGGSSLFPSDYTCHCSALLWVWLPVQRHLPNGATNCSGKAQPRRD